MLSAPSFRQLHLNQEDPFCAQLRYQKKPYPLGDTRAVMIEGPSREALELVEVK